MNELAGAVFESCSGSRPAGPGPSTWGPCGEERRDDGQRLRIGARYHVDVGGAREALRKWQP